MSCTQRRSGSSHLISGLRFRSEPCGPFCASFVCHTNVWWRAWIRLLLAQPQRGYTVSAEPASPFLIMFFRFFTVVLNVSAIMVVGSHGCFVLSIASDVPPVGLLQLVGERLLALRRQTSPNRKIWYPQSLPKEFEIITCHSDRTKVRGWLCHRGPRDLYREHAVICAALFEDACQIILEFESSALLKDSPFIRSDTNILRPEVRFWSAGNLRRFW